MYFVTFYPIIWKLQMPLDHKIHSHTLLYHNDTILVFYQDGRYHTSMARGKRWVLEDKPAMLSHIPIGFLFEGFSARICPNS